MTTMTLLHLPADAGNGKTLAKRIEERSDSTASLFDPLGERGMMGNTRLGVVRSEVPLCVTNCAA